MIIHRKKVALSNMGMGYLNIGLVLASGVILLPYSLKYIPVSDYGYWLVVGEFFSWLIILDPGIGVVIKQKVAFSYGKNDLRSISQHLFSLFIILFFLLCLFSVGGVLLFLNVDFIINTESARIQYFDYAALLGIAGTVFALLSYPINAFNSGLLSSVSIGAFDVFANFLRIIVSISLLLAGYGVMALGFGIFVSGFFLFLSNAFYLIKKKFQFGLTFEYNRANLLGLLRLMTFTFLGSFSQIVLRNSNLFFVNRFFGSTDAVLLKINQTIPELGRQFLERPIMAMNPSISHLHGEGNIVRLRIILADYFCYLFIAVGFFLVAVICLSKSFIGLWVGIDFFGGHGLIILIAVSFVLRVFASTFSNILFSLGSIKKNNIVLFVKSIVYLVLMVFMLKTLGLIGIFVAIIVCEIAISLWYYSVLLYQHLNFGRAQLSAALRDILLTCFISLTVIFSFQFVSPLIESWLDLFLSAFVMFVSYLVLVFGAFPFIRVRLSQFYLLLK